MEKVNAVAKISPEVKKKGKIDAVEKGITFTAYISGLLERAIKNG